MHAIILAAGRGNRLADFNPEGHPKCLLSFGGRTLLARHLDLLFRLGINRVDLVIGFEADRIIEHVGLLSSRPDVAFHFNPRFQLGSVISLLAAKDALVSGDPILLMDADVLYHPEILSRLIRSHHENCFLVDRNLPPGDEPVKIAVRGNEMVDFRKRLEPDLRFDYLGESVGFFRFGPGTGRAIAAECGRFDAEGLSDAPHEEVLRNLLLARPEGFGFEDVTGLPWIEIDFPEDVVRARDEVLTAIRADVREF